MFAGAGPFLQQTSAGIADNEKEETPCFIFATEERKEKVAWMRPESQKDLLTTGSGGLGKKYRDDAWSSRGFCSSWSLSLSYSLFFSLFSFLVIVLLFAAGLVHKPIDSRRWLTVTLLAECDAGISFIMFGETCVYVFLPFFFVLLFPFVSRICKFGGGDAGEIDYARSGNQLAWPMPI